MTSGGAGYEFGNEHVNHFDGSYASNLNTTATLQQRYILQLFYRFDWQNFAPDQTHQVVTAGYGTSTTNNLNLFNATYATTTWDGSTTSITYAPVSTTLTVNLARFSAPVNAYWFDPTAGTYSTISGSPFTNSGTHNFTSPAAHSDTFQDWVLVLTENVPPSITTQPANQTVTAGQTASFSVTATGTAPLSYQWQKNGTTISGATSPSYTTPATTSSDNGAVFTVVVSNSAGSVTSSAATLTVTTPGQLNSTAASLPFGNVNVGSSSTQSVTLTNTGGSNVSISNITISGAGFSVSGISTGLILNPGASVTMNVIFAPAASGSVTGSVTISSNASNSPLTISTSGTGVVATHSATLTWTASPSVVVGYNVYRSSIPSGPYTKLNSAADASTTFADSSVLSGQTYYYVVTAVDSNNVESAYSNQVTAVIP
jgi:hypothetical protein